MNPVELNLDADEMEITKVGDELVLRTLPPVRYT